MTYIAISIELMIYSIIGGSAKTELSGYLRA